MVLALFECLLLGVELRDGHMGQEKVCVGVWTVAWEQQGEAQRCRR